MQTPRLCESYHRYGLTEADGDEYVTFNGDKVYVVAGAENENGTKQVAGHAGVTANTWYSYTTNEAGEVTLKTLAENSYANAVTGITVETGKADTDTGYAANSKTVLTVVDKNGIAVTYNGIANFPEEGEIDSEVFSVLVTHAKTGTVGADLAKNIFVYVGDEVIEGAKDYIYVVMAWSYDEETTTYWAYQNGATTFITFNNDNLTDMNTMTMYSVCTISTENGEYVASLVETGKYKNDGNTGAQLWYEEATIDTVDENYFTTVEVDVDGYEDLVATLVEVPEPEYKTEITDEDNEVLFWSNPFDPTSDMIVWNTNGHPEDGSKWTPVVLNQDDIDAANEENAESEAKIEKLMEDTICGYNVKSKLYYYDNDTVIYDCVNGGFLTELSSGDSFLAVMDTKDPTLCAYIWIVA